MNPELDDFFLNAPNWRAEMEQLRSILLESQLSEALKWKAPCYTFDGKNIAVIGALKDCCVLSFFKGALLKDENGLLEQPGKNTQSARIIRFTKLQAILDLSPVLSAYIHEAIEIEKAGLKVDFKEKDALEFPSEFQDFLAQNPELKIAFNALTPGRQRGYNLHFSAPKQSKTRTARIQKCIPRILDGKGLNDR